MNYSVFYSVNCKIGRVRGKNQDNFWCAGHYLEAENDGLSVCEYGSLSASELPAFAVFDGMGGGLRGEYAAFLAAREFDRRFEKRRRFKEPEFLFQTCGRINAEICRYEKEHGISNMGTTGAVLLFSKSGVFACNVGDSRIYRFRNRELLQISVDHSRPVGTGKKPPLTQYLGLPEEEFALCPYLAKGACRYGDRFLICSDGLTDMVSEREIKTILGAQPDAVSCNVRLLQTALENGGRDNVTIIVCEIRKQEKKKEAQL